MSRPITAVIHPQALKHNLAILRQYAAASQVFTVVKANAYGHGIARVFDAFKSADGFALLDIAEAKVLRELGWNGPILLLEGIFRAEDLQDCARYNLSFSLHSPAQLAWLEAYASTTQAPAQFDIFLKMNSGMNRLGFRPSDYRAAWQRLNALDHVASITHMTHFSDADGMRLGARGIDYQLEVFEATIAELPGRRSVSNSAAILRHHAPSTQQTHHPQSDCTTHNSAIAQAQSSTAPLHSDVVRGGIMLYGSSPDYPSHSIQDWDLQPSMSLRSELISIQQLDPDETVGYGSNFTASVAMKIGIVACGYADGYQRISPTGTPILVNGIRTRTIGRVSMDMLAVDLSPIPDAEIGDEVVLWGSSVTGAILPIDDVAAAANTVGYELMCAVTARVQFVLDPEYSAPTLLNKTAAASA